MPFHLCHRFICLLLGSFSCWKAERAPAPEIIWEKPMSGIMGNFCCYPTGSNVGPPILLPGPSLLVSGTHIESFASTFFKIKLPE
jgi:hypothetical protein